MSHLFLHIQMSTQLGLSQPVARSWAFHLDLQVWQRPICLSHYLLPSSVCVSRKLESVVELQLEPGTPGKDVGVFNGILVTASR